MKKTYMTPTLEEVGAVSAITAALGTSARRDFSEFPAIPPSNGSVDLCVPGTPRTPPSDCQG